MDLFDLKHNNAVLIYKSILNGKNTLSDIAKDTGISLLTVSELANDMVKREILDISKPRRDGVGRRKHVFRPSHKYFSYFIDRQQKYFSTIGISTDGLAVERFDYPLNYEKKTMQEVLDKNVLRRIRTSPSYKYCMAIYLIGDENDNFVVDSDVIKTTKEELIALSLADKDKLSLFEFNGKCMMSLYYHLHKSDTDTASLCKIIPFDNVYTFEGNLYYDAFESLKRIAITNIENII